MLKDSQKVDWEQEESWDSVRTGYFPNYSLKFCAQFCRVTWISHQMFGLGGGDMVHGLSKESFRRPLDLTAWRCAETRLCRLVLYLCILPVGAAGPRDACPSPWSSNGVCCELLSALGCCLPLACSLMRADCAGNLLHVAPSSRRWPPPPHSVRSSSLVYAVLITLLYSAS